MDTTPIQSYTPEQLAQRRQERAVRRRRKKLMQGVILFIGFVALVLVLMGVRTIWKWTEGARARSRYGTGNYDVSEYVFRASDPRLVLVNQYCSVSTSTAPELEVADDATGQQLAPEAAEAFRNMVQAAAEEKIKLSLGSGYRDTLTQDNLFQKLMERYTVQGYSQEEAEAIAWTVTEKGGYSEHQTGYVADIVTDDYPVPDSEFAKTKAYAWLVRYAPEYGFILRYPEERQAATGHIEQPWHWRYVGVDNAQAITASGLSLEEFLALHTAQETPAE